MEKTTEKESEKTMENRMEKTMELREESDLVKMIRRIRNEMQRRADDGEEMLGKEEIEEMKKLGLMTREVEKRVIVRNAGESADEVSTWRRGVLGRIVMEYEALLLACGEDRGSNGKRNEKKEIYKGKSMVGVRVGGRGSEVENAALRNGKMRAWKSEVDRKLRKIEREMRRGGGVAVVCKCGSYVDRRYCGRCGRASVMMVGRTLDGEPRDR